MVNNCLFDLYIGVDYSGAATPSSPLPGLRIYVAEPSSTAVPLERNSTKSRERNSTKSRRTMNWSRETLAEQIQQLLDTELNVIIAIDHAFSFPMAYMQRNRIDCWDRFLEHVVAGWPTDAPMATVEQFRSKQGSSFGAATEKRLTEQWTSGAKSVFQFDVQGSVAKSTLAGLPFLLRLRRRFPSLHFWPFDGWEIPRNRSVVTESWPSLFRERYPRQRRTTDQQDAFATATWLNEMDQRRALHQFFKPPLDAHQRRTAALEGWILGVV